MGCPSTMGEGCCNHPRPEALSDKASLPGHGDLGKAGLVLEETQRSVLVLGHDVDRFQLWTRAIRDGIVSPVPIPGIKARDLSNALSHTHLKHHSPPNTHAYHIPSPTTAALPR